MSRRGFEEGKDMLINLCRLLFMDEMSNTFHHNHLLQQRAIFLQSPTMNFNFTSRPRCCQFPVSASSISIYINCQQHRSKVKLKK